MPSNPTQNGPLIDLIASASSASWYTRAGAIPFGGDKFDSSGFVSVLPGSSARLEDGSAPEHLQMIPEWVEYGWMNGDYTLSRPIGEGDHFRATIGFAPPPQRISRGDAEFVVIALFDNGESLDLSRTHDVGFDGNLIQLDVSLAPALGASKLRLRVEAGATPAEDWAVWINPRVER